MPTKTITLHAASASAGGKFYTIDINPAGERFTVDFRHGAVGGNTMAGTKTKTPVPLAEAEKIFDKLMRDKMNGDSHYTPSGTAGAAVVTPVPGEIAGPRCFAPRLLNDVDTSQVQKLVNDDAWYVQIKHDGDRVQLHGAQGFVTLFSGRSAKVRACPAAIQAAVSRYAHSIELDGELVGDVLFAFDVLGFDGHDFRGEPYWSRLEALASICAALACDSIRLVGTAAEPCEKHELVIAAKANSAEGVVFLNKNARYEAGRRAVEGTISAGSSEQAPA